MPPLIRNISDTARWVAVFRADESERPDAIFHDPFARKLAGEHGEQIADTITFGRTHSWSFVARTFSFDEIIRQHIEQGYDMIINLACGLDTRPYRMQLPATLQWIEVDLPEMISYKKEVMADEKPNCKLESIQLDLADSKLRAELFNELNSRCSRALIVAEGLVAYLDYTEAALLARDLSAQKHFKRWVFDMMSPQLAAMLQKEMGSFLEEANAPLKFAPVEGEAFFLPHGWRSLESRSHLKIAATLNRLSAEMLAFAAYPEPQGPKGDIPWAGVCLFENIE